jgi:lysophospholipase L1-like esterase
MRICFFGDSFVNGAGDDEALGWVGRLCAAERRAGLDLTAYNLGVRRDTSADVRTRWRREAKARLPHGLDGRLVFSFGLNDGADSDAGTGPRVARSRTLKNAKTILREASALAPTLMIGPLPVTDSRERNAEIVALSDGLHRHCVRREAPFLSLVAFAETHYDLWRAEAAAGDGIHPNARSYAALAETIGASPAWRTWLGKRP